MDKELVVKQIIGEFDAPLPDIQRIGFRPGCRYMLGLPTIKFMVITRSQKCSSKCAIALLTSNMKLHCFQMSFMPKTRYLSELQMKNIHDVFGIFMIDANTEVIIDRDTVSNMCPLCIYMTVLSTHIDFKTTRVSLADAIIRLRHKHRYMPKCDMLKYNKFTRGNYMLHYAWQYLSKRDICPWITRAIDDQLKMVSRQERNRQIKLRIYLYYMAVRAANRYKSKMSKLRKQKKLEQSNGFKEEVK